MLVKSEMIFLLSSEFVIKTTWSPAANFVLPFTILYCSTPAFRAMRTRNVPGLEISFNSFPFVFESGDISHSTISSCPLVTV